MASNLYILSSTPYVPAGEWVGNIIIPEGCASLACLSRVTAIKGYLVIDNSDLVGLEGLEQLCRVRDFIRIKNNQYLKSLKGLANLTECQGSMLILDNPVLATLQGLDKLERVGDFFRIERNPVLLDLNSLSRLYRVNLFTICFNEALKQIHGLSALAICSNSLFIENNPALITLKGLESLRQVDDTLCVKDNARLQRLEGLEHLEIVRKNLYVKDNPLLNDVSALTTLRLVRYIYIDFIHLSCWCEDGVPPLILKFN